MSPVRIPLLVDKLYCSHFALPQGEPKMADCNRGEDYFSAQDHEASTVVQKYGGLAPKKKPLISKDHERAFFDSADWALCKQGAGVNPKSTAAVETLQPKLQRTPHQQLPPRRPACTSDHDI
ncbi:hypothetical protein L3X38_002204 [Prunus dulcis]|uniref:cAMP-regulated phosphoprotein 19-related protein n=2 Tax=Prunus dulcis TaxID=3755 RepID=A0AAD4WVS9_PRUDU|nr:hypothetical protein L3X38_002204 [Prunus dulcis]